MNYNKECDLQISLQNKKMQIMNSPLTIIDKIKLLEELFTKELQLKNSIKNRLVGR